MSNYDNAADIVNYLINNHGFKYNADNTKLQRGKCPACGKKEAWAKVDRPHYIYCNRSNNCGVATKVFDIAPHLYQSITERFEYQLEKNPLAIADAYLKHERGFNIEEMKGWYSQSIYRNPNGNIKPFSVVFHIAKGVFFERFVETVTLTDPDTGDKTDRKNRIVGNYQGKVWNPPNQTIEKYDRIYITEAIFKSIALIQNGKKSVSALSASHFPTDFIKEHADKEIEWIIALDSDKAGCKYTLEHIEKLKAMKQHYNVVLPPKGKDWDDLHREERLSPTDFSTYQYYGDLLKATSREEKALAIYHHTSQSQFVYTFNKRTYFCEIDLEKYEKYVQEKMQDVIDRETKKQNSDSYQLTEEEEKQIRDRALMNQKIIREIANFTMDFLYYEQPDVGEEGEYFFNLAFSNGTPPKKLAFSGGIFSSSSDFKKAIQRKAPGGLFSGSSQHLDMLYRQWFRYSPKQVKTINYIGYHKPEKAYIFPKIAVQQGKLINRNADEFFQLKNTGIKPMTSIDMDIGDNGDCFWLDDFRTAYGTKGLTALVWWFGSLFASQIRSITKIYPFIEIFGEPSAGKTWMIEFLWKLYGREEEEGFDISKSTLSGRVRRLSQVSNLPVVIIESDVDDKSHARKFDWEELKPLSDGRIGRVTGQKDQSNTTKEPLFLGSIMIAQNNCIEASEAVLSRLVQIYFDRSHHSPAGKLAADRLDDIPAEKLSGVMIKIIQNEKEIFETFSELLKPKEKMLKQQCNIEMGRIVNTHAELMAMAHALRCVIPFKENDLHEIEKYIFELATKRQQAIEADHPSVQQFWANVDYLDSIQVTDASQISDIPPEEWKPAGSYHNNAVGLRVHQMNHATNPDEEIHINITHYTQQCRKHQLETATEKELRKILPNSRKRKYIGNSTQRSRLMGKTMRVWKFKR